MKLFKYLFRSKISITLIFIFVCAIIGYFISDKNYTWLLAFAILNILGTLYSSGRFFDLLYHIVKLNPDKYGNLLNDLNLPSSPVEKPKLNIFVIIVNIVIVIAALLMAYFIIEQLILR